MTGTQKNVGIWPVSIERRFGVQTDGVGMCFIVLLKMVRTGGADDFRQTSWGI